MSVLRMSCARIALPALLLALADPVFAATIVERLRDAFARTAPQLRPELHGDDGVVLHMPKGGTVTVYADAVEAECSHNADQCDQAIDKFSATTASVVTQERDVALTESNVYPVVRSAQMLNSLGDPSRLGPDKGAISRPFSTDSIVLYAVDSPNALRFAVGMDLKKQGLSEERLQAIAKANVGRLPPVKVSVMPNSNGLVAALTQDGYGTSRLFDVNFVQLLERTAGGPVIVAVPTRDWILAVKADDPAAVARLRDVAGRIFRGERYAVTADLIRWDGNAWQVVPPGP